jgi:hypothetical protein
MFLLAGFLFLMHHSLSLHADMLKDSVAHLAATNSTLNYSMSTLNNSMFFPEIPSFFNADTPMVHFLNCHETSFEQCVRDAALSTCSVLSLIFWMSTLKFGLASKETGEFVQFVMLIFTDLFWFLFMLLVFMLAFTHSFFIFFHRPSSLDLFHGDEAHSFSSIGNTWLTTYGMVLGDYPVKELDDHWISIVCYVLFSLVVTLTLLNALIAKLSVTYDKVTQKAMGDFAYTQALLVTDIEANWEGCMQWLASWKKLQTWPLPFSEALFSDNFKTWVSIELEFDDDTEKSIQDQMTKLNSVQSELQQLRLDQKQMRDEMKRNFTAQSHFTGRPGKKDIDDEKGEDDNFQGSAAQGFDMNAEATDTLKHLISTCVEENTGRLSQQASMEARFGDMEKKLEIILSAVEGRSQARHSTSDIGQGVGGLGEDSRPNRDIRRSGSAPTTQMSPMSPPPQVKMIWETPGGESVTVFARRQPLGLNFNKELPIVVTAAKEGSHGKELGIQPGWSLKSLEGTDVSARSKYKFEDVSRLLQAAMGKLSR